MYALVTGATSGIGYEFAKIMAENNYNLILIARREDRLERIKEDFTKLYGINVVIYKCDLGDISQVKEMIEFTKEYKDIDVVVNSAGFGKMGYINEIDVADDIDMINTNITALHLITKHFSMVMDKGNIINVSSIAGVTPTPYMSQYGATKAYVYSLSRALNYEMKKIKKNVKIMVACPGPVDTEFHDRANSKFRLKSISARKCAMIMYKAMKKNKSRVMVSLPIIMSSLLIKILPSGILLPIEYKIQTKKNQ